MVSQMGISVTKRYCWQYSEIKIWYWHNDIKYKVFNLFNPLSFRDFPNHGTFSFLTKGWPQNQMEKWQGRRNRNIWLGLLRGVLQASFLICLNKLRLKLAYNCRKHNFLSDGIVTFDQRRPTTADWNKIKTVKLIFIKLRTNIGLTFVQMAIN